MGIEIVPLPGWHDRWPQTVSLLYGEPTLLSILTKTAAAKMFNFAHIFEKNRWGR
jgi:hypothetical protein